MTCHHKHGDYVPGFGHRFWVCGQCYEKLVDRPTRYRMQRPGEVFERGSVQIEWQADIRVAESGLTLGTFLNAMAAYFRWTDKKLSMFAAFDLAIDAMRAADIEFGSPDMEWTRDAAEDMAKEEISEFWEMDDGEANE